jgi:phage tail protein X
MAVYLTKSGDTFDIIAFEVLGDRRYTKELMEVNPRHIGTLIFSNGIELNIPEISDEVVAVGALPWR